MEISLVAEKITTNDQTILTVSNYFKAICDVLKFDHLNIHKVVFADDNNYGSEIKKIDPDADYTKTKEHIGFGKTMLLENGKSSIVLNACLYNNNC
jgi:hypothetical protein